PRSPLRRRGYRIRSGSFSWLIVAGPLAQLRPRDPGWAGLPSSFLTDRSNLSTYASSPHADSQLKQVVGISMYSCGTFFGCAFASYSTWWSHDSTGGKLRRCSWERSPGSGSVLAIRSSLQAVLERRERHVLRATKVVRLALRARRLTRARAGKPARAGRRALPTPATRRSTKARRSAKRRPMLRRNPSRTNARIDRVRASSPQLSRSGSHGHRADRRARSQHGR